MLSMKRKMRVAMKIWNLKEKNITRSEPCFHPLLVRGIAAAAQANKSKPLKLEFLGKAPELPEACSSDDDDNKKATQSNGPRKDHTPKHKL